MVFEPMTILEAEGMKVTVAPPITTGEPVMAAAAEKVIPPRTRRVVGVGEPGCWVGNAAVRVPTWRIPEEKTMVWPPRMVGVLPATGIVVPPRMTGAEP